MTKIYIVNESSFTVGRGDFCTFSIPENDMLSKIHAIVNITRDSVFLTMNGKNGGYLDNRFICCKESVPLLEMVEIRLPLITFTYVNGLVIISSDKTVITKCKEFNNYNDTSDEGLVSDGNVNYTKFFSAGYIEDEKIEESFSSLPRTIVLKDNSTVEIEAPPEKREETLQNKLLTVGPALTMVIPMLLGVFVSMIFSRSDTKMSGAFMYTGLITAAGSAFLGIMWSMLNLKERKQQLEIAERKRQKCYREYIQSKDELLKIKYIKCKNDLLMMNPCIHDYFDESNSKYILWNRNNEDEDFLNIRLGFGKDLFSVHIEIPKYRFSLTDDELKVLPFDLKKKYEYIRDVPICVNLIENNLVGVVVEDNTKKECIFNLMILNCACQAEPEKIQICVMLTDFADVVNCDRYSYIRFIPHIQSEYGLLLAFNKDRAVKIQGTIIDLTNENHFVILFTDNYNVLTEDIKKNPNIKIVVFTDSFESLSGECRCIVHYSDSFSGIINLCNRETKRYEIIFDEINIKQAESYARKLQGLYGGRRETMQLPTTLSFFNIIKNDSIEIEDVVKNWKNNLTKTDIKIPIGIDMEGVTYLDLDEKAMGPHGLLAGMTGSGKSEILQTIILSLIYKYSPYEVGLFLIDYKGGGMSTLFEGIPHLLGSISNLSGRMINRAMISIRSECLRRQRIFLNFSVNKIAEYQEKFYKGEAKEALPHIFIIIDEFAELKKEEPEFMNELISVARVGRSLGLHLILATQKPSSCVDDNIWSNSRFRISLRVQDKQDSNEMLHKPDAAFIKNVGRAYLQVGNDEIYKCFQGAYTGTKVLSGTINSQEVFLIDEEGKQIKDSFYNTYSEDAQTELQVICDTVKETYIIFNSLSNKSNIENRLWLNPLPENLILPDCITNNSRQTNTTTITIGKYDDPYHQRQGYTEIDLFKEGNIAILGEAKSGKSTLLQTILLQFCQFKNEELNFYIIDFSLAMLKPFKNTPACGGYINEDNIEDLKRLFILLNEEISERKKLLQGGNYTQYINNKNNRMPLLVVVIDGLSTMREYMTEDDEFIFYNLLKQSLTYGIYFYVSANEISAHDMTQRIFEKINRTVSLLLKDKYAYKEALRITGNDFEMPESICGRGLIKEGDEVVEMQIFEPVMASNDYERIEVLMEFVNGVNERTVNKFGVKKVPQIPDKPTIKQLLNDFICRFSNMSNSVVCEIPLGYEIESGKVLSIELFKGTVLITGKPGSGKHDFLKGLLKMADYMKGETEFKGSFVCEKNDENEEVDVVSVTCNKTKMKFVIADNISDFEIIDEITNSSKEQLCVINLGGEVDRCQYGDFSYMSYSKQNKTLNKGHGHISKNEHISFYGEIITPLAIYEREEQ